VGDALIRWSLRNRVAALAVAAFVLVYGAALAARMPVDVLPDINAPTVTVITEAHGMAPDEVETLVTLPLETSLNGVSGLRRLRSSSGIGISVVWAEFDWDTDPWVARQVVSERIQVARGSLPDNVAAPLMAPMSSIMGEIMFIGLTGDEQVDPMELRDLAEWDLRRRLLGIPGIAQVSPIGGALKQIQVVADTEAMRQLGVGHGPLVEAVRTASGNAPGGFVESGHQEYLLRGVGRPASLQELEMVVVGHRDGVPVLLRQVAHVHPGPAPSRGTAAVDGEPAVVLAIQKQPAADTLAVTDAIDATLDDVEATLPAGITLHRHGFRQARFIETAIGNVQRHIVESALLVVLLLTVFLMNWRTTVISLVALPLSLLTGVLVLAAMGDSFNTMTLGGFAIAIGALVDDAIIYVENVFRRLRQRADLPPEERAPFFDVVFDASREIMGSIVYATAVIVVVFLPLFFLSGLEGRLLAPLGKAYVVSISASLLVAITITPAMCSLLLRDVAGGGGRRDSWLVRRVKGLYRPILEATLARPNRVLAGALVGVLAALVLFLSFGRSFLPRFNEGSYTIAAATAPGTTLTDSDRMVDRLDDALVELPFVTSVIRRTGRAENDEHAQDVQFSELEVTVEPGGLSRAELTRRVREVSEVPGLVVSVGQPIGHRIEHMLSGVKTSVAVKVYGDDLVILRAVARQIEGAMATVPGVVDLAVEQQTDIPQIVVRPRYAALAQLGLRPGELSEFIETAYLGHVVGQWWERQRAYDLVVRYPESFGDDLEAVAQTPIDADGSAFVSLEQVARVDATLGPNLINRENVQRRIVVMANVEGRDITGVVRDIRRNIGALVEMPPAVHVEYGGEFESEQRASRTIFALSLLAVAAMFAILWVALRSARDAALVMVNLPLALVGGAVAVLAMGGILSVASLVGFITLFGIATRNGILLITHYRHLMREEGEELLGALRRGSMERLVPILMTAAGTGLALIPLALALDEPGNEIQAPMALVILGGLITSTLLNLVVVPALMRRFTQPRGPGPS